MKTDRELQQHYYNMIMANLFLATAMICMSLSTSLVGVLMGVCAFGNCGMYWYWDVKQTPINDVESKPSLHEN